MSIWGGGLLALVGLLTTMALVKLCAVTDPYGPECALIIEQRKGITFPADGRVFIKEMNLPDGRVIVEYYVCPK